MALKRKRRRGPGSEPEFARPPRRKRRLMRRLFVLSLLLLGIVVAAPTIVANTPLRNLLLARSMPAGGWRIEAKQASFSWWSSQSLGKVAIVDPQGNPLLAADSMTLERSLLAMAINRRDLGGVQLTRPVVDLVTRPDGSNIEDFVAASQTEASPSDAAGPTSNEPMRISLEMIDGTVRGFDVASQQKWQLSEANLSTKLGSRLVASGSATLRINGRKNPGRLKFRLQEADDGNSRLEVLAEACPLQPLQPWLTRTVAGGKVAGVASADAQVRWSFDSQQRLTLETSGRVEASQLQFSADALAGDRLEFDQLSAPWQLSVSGDRVTVDQLAVDGGWVKLRAQGSAVLSQLASLSLANLPRQQTTIAGSVALDRLAAMLPRTLQLRRGVRLDGGQLEFRAAAQPGPQGLAWTADATVRDLSGTDGRHRIRWQQPVEVSAHLADTPTGPQLEQLQLSAPFAKAKFVTDRGTVNGSFQVDLDQLAQEVEQFVDLGRWRFRGRGEGNLALTRKGNARFTADADIKLTDFDVADGEHSLWSESQLQIDLTAAGSQNELKPTSLSDAVVNVRGARDQIDLQLLESVDLTSETPLWKLKVQGNGPLDLWADRLRPWVSALPAELSGDARLEATVHVAKGAMHVIESLGTINELMLQTESLTIEEPRVQFSGDCRWDAATGAIAARDFQLSGSTLALRSRDVTLRFDHSAAPSASGNVAFRADLERVATMLHKPATWPRGQVEGRLNLTSNARTVQAEFSATAEQLEVVRAAAGAGYSRTEILWSEPRLEVGGKLVYDISSDHAQLENLQLTGKTVRLTGSAKVVDVRTAGRLQADGVAQYDPAALAALVAHYAGPDVQLQGDRQVRFQLSGLLSGVEGAATHWSQRWNIKADAGWSGASVYGLQLSGGKISGTLGDGQLQIAPLDLAVGQGRLTATPRATLAPGPGQIILPKGPLVSHVAISPQVSETMLKYVAPILAGATRTEGEFSIDLDGTQFPLADPKQIRVAGRLGVHRLRIAPGPMMTDLARLVAQVEALAKRKQFLQAATGSGGADAVTISDRQIDFQISEGRVYHRNLEFLIDDVPVRSYGSVGFDQSLALMIEIPIQQKWVDGERLLRGLAGQTLQVPITGTFQKPRIDERAIASLSQQLLQGAANQAIGNELNRQLDKLLGR